MTVREVKRGEAVFVRANDDGGITIGSGGDVYQAIVRAVPCPWCQRKAGERCLTSSQRPATRVHMSRFHRFWEGESAPVSEEL